MSTSGVAALVTKCCVLTFRCKTPEAGQKQALAPTEEYISTINFHEKNLGEFLQLNPFWRSSLMPFQAELLVPQLCRFSLTINFGPSCFTANPKSRIQRTDQEFCHEVSQRMLYSTSIREAVRLGLPHRDLACRQVCYTFALQPHYLQG